MAQIISRNNPSILKIKEFLGLNENPDGDTVLKVGEMTEMRNFRITQDKHLQLRPGTQNVLPLFQTWLAGGGYGRYGAAEPTLCGVWYGTVAGRDVLLVAFGGGIFLVDTQNWTAAEIGVCAQDETTFFGFGNKVYLLNGHEYMSWDGDSAHTFQSVTGYVPLTHTALTPAGSGTTVENVNRLCNLRRVQFSPDGTATVFQLPEKDIADVQYVELEGAEVTSYTKNLTDGTVTLQSAPAQGTNTLLVMYSKGTSTRNSVTSMRYSELYNGNTDTRVFLYGDGSSKAIYSGIDGDTGLPSAEYFPDLYEVSVGESNTPLTGLVRHYNRLMAFKSNSAWVIQYTTLNLEGGSAIAAFYVQPANRQFGNDAAGQVKLVENNPLTIDAGSIYQWKSTNAYSGYITTSENNASRISDRVRKTLRAFDPSGIRTYNIKASTEYWFLCGDKALILNYGTDTWYSYEKLPFRALVEIENEVYGISEIGTIMHVSRAYRRDNGGEFYPLIAAANWENSPLGSADGGFTFTYDGTQWSYDGEAVDLADYGITISFGTPRPETKLTVIRKTSGSSVGVTLNIAVPIDAYCATGAMDFDRDWLLKYSPMIFVAMQPESGARIIVTVETNKRSDYPEKAIAYNLFSFLHMDFNHFSFGTNRKPQTKRVKMKVKKATFYRMIFKSKSTSATATVIETDVQLRYAGTVK